MRRYLSLSLIFCALAAANAPADEKKDNSPLKASPPSSTAKT